MGLRRFRGRRFSGNRRATAFGRAGRPRNSRRRRERRGIRSPSAEKSRRRLAADRGDEASSLRLPLARRGNGDGRRRLSREDLRRAASEPPHPRRLSRSENFGGFPRSRGFVCCARALFFPAVRPSFRNLRGVCSRGKFRRLRACGPGAAKRGNRLLRKRRAERACLFRRRLSERLQRFRRGVSGDSLRGGKSRALARRLRERKQSPCGGDDYARFRGRVAVPAGKNAGNRIRRRRFRRRRDDGRRASARRRFRPVHGERHDEPRRGVSAFSERRSRALPELRDALDGRSGNARFRKCALCRRRGAGVRSAAGNAL